MRHSIGKYAITLGLGSALAIGAASAAAAAPVPALTGAVKAAAPAHVTDVRWYGGPGPFIGALAFGLGTAAVLGAPYWGCGPDGYRCSYPYAYAGYPYAHYPYGYRYAYAYPHWGWHRYRHWHHYR
jgi:hypothetical protein